MAEAAWRARVRQRVESAQERLRDAYGVQGLGMVKGSFLTPVAPFVTAPGQEAYVSSMRTKLRLMMDLITEVAQNLDSAVVDMEAAEILALRGSNLSGPEWPLLSAQLLGPQEAALQTALGRLRTSRDMAEVAYTFVRWCRGHLSMTIALADSLGILIYGESKTVYVALDVAISRTEEALRDATSALQFLAPP